VSEVQVEGNVTVFSDVFLGYRVKEIFCEQDIFL